MTGGSDPDSLREPRLPTATAAGLEPALPGAVRGLEFAQSAIDALTRQPCDNPEVWAAAVPDLLAVCNWPERKPEHAPGNRLPFDCWSAEPWEFLPAKAFAALQAMAGRVPAADDAITEMVVTDNPRFAAGAREVLLRIGPQRAAGRLLAALDSEKPNVRACAAHLLGHVGPQAEIRPHLVRLLDDGSKVVRANVVDALLRGIRTEFPAPAFPPAELIPLVVRLLTRGPFPGYRVIPEARALVWFGPAAVPVATDLLAHAHTSVVANAAFVLGELGAASELALPALDALRRHPEEDVRIAAKSAMDRIAAAMLAG